MKKGMVFGFGEIVYDIIFKKNKIVIGQPGGSVLNALVNISSRKCKTSLISQLSGDELGKNIKVLLDKAGINTDLLIKSKYKTKVALSFLDEKNNATYLFHEEKEDAKPGFSFPELSDSDIFLFGSTAAIDPKNRAYLDSILNKADAFSTLVYYDPNIRKSAMEKYSDYKDLAIRYISRADIVRGTVDDFEAIFNTRSPETIFKHIDKLGVPVLIITDGENPVYLFVNKSKIVVKFKPVKALCSIAAGDAFNAGIISSLILSGNKKYSVKNITEKNWNKYLKDSITIATEVCKTYDNYPKLG